jgi:hypothetical protein
MVPWLAIANLADEHDVGILADDGSQRSAYCHAGRLVERSCTILGRRYSNGSSAVTAFTG